MLLGVVIQELFVAVPKICSLATSVYVYVADRRYTKEYTKERTLHMKCMFMMPLITRYHSWLHAGKYVCALCHALPASFELGDCENTYMCMWQLEAKGRGLCTSQRQSDAQSFPTRQTG